MRKLFTFCILLSFSLLVGNSANAQKAVSGALVLDGLIYGYNYEPSKKLLAKDKQLKVEGVLDNVEVAVKEKGKVISSTRSKSNGTFSIELKTDKVYTLEFSKPGYTTTFFTVDLTAATKELASLDLRFSGAEFIMNSYQSKNKDDFDFPFGKLYYNAKTKYVDFETAKFLNKKQREYVSNPVSLMMRSVQKNKSATKTSPPKNEIGVAVKERVKSKNDLNTTVSGKEDSEYTDSIASKLLEYKRRIRLDPQKVSASDIADLEEQVEAARLKYEEDKLNARSPGDSLKLKLQGDALESVELELVSAKRIIELQKNEISTQRNLLILSVAFVLLLLILLFLIYRFNSQKKRTYLLLKEKNKKIVDSINYASRIQESVLPSPAEIQELLPESFIYYQPRDVVSGDFYWLSSINEKIIIACVDCTGHGVPGAFMSLIGNTLLNEIVNERKVLDPSQILKELHLNIVRSLHQNTNRAQSKDGMEMSLCVIDNKSKSIAFAGAMNPIYIVQSGEVKLIQPDLKGIGGETQAGASEDYTTKQISIESGMSLYMFTDGYMDQFGGPENKKFNIPNFKKLLLNMENQKMETQGEVVERTIQEWKGSQKQIDDMLVIGIKF